MVYISKYVLDVEDVSMHNASCFARLSSAYDRISEILLHAVDGVRSAI